MAELTATSSAPAAPACSRRTSGSPTTAPPRARAAPRGDRPARGRQRRLLRPARAGPRHPPLRAGARGDRPRAGASTTDERAAPVRARPAAASAPAAAGPSASAPTVQRAAGRACSVPAMVIGRRMDVARASTRSRGALMGGFRERNMAPPRVPRRGRARALPGVGRDRRRDRRLPAPDRRARTPTTRQLIELDRRAQRAQRGLPPSVGAPRRQLQDVRRQALRRTRRSGRSTLHYECFAAPRLRPDARHLHGRARAARPR